MLRVGGERGAAARCAALVVVSAASPTTSTAGLAHDVLAPVLRAARGAPHWDVAAHVCGDDSACCYVACARARARRAREERGAQPGRAASAWLRRRWTTTTTTTTGRPGNARTK